MRIALAQLNYTIGDFENNILRIRDAIRRAKSEQADLIVFAELCICAYPPRDFLEFSDFIERCKIAAEEIAEDCYGITAIVGLPTQNPKREGKNLFNSACILSEGKITDTVHKALLPNYDIFDEYRYFEPNRSFHSVEIKNTKIALNICEDLWNIDDDPMYINCPMDELIRDNPKLIINIAASPFDYGHAEYRIDILRRNVQKYNLPLIYVNHVGAQTELIFDGGSLVLDKTGSVVKELNYFREDFHVFDFDPVTGQISNEISSDGIKTGSAGKKIQQSSLSIPLPKTERIHDALVLGIRDYFAKQGFKKAILGLSGGIDSAVVIVLAVEALGSDNVKALLMPSVFSSEGSISDSRQLSENLNISYDIVPIEKIAQQFQDSLKPFFKNLPFSTAEENIQARIRGVLSMAMSNKFGYILLNTSNKSELAVGYGTLYGDMCGGLSVIGDVYKTGVYELASFINREIEMIPSAIITKPPSAELRPQQKDSDSLPEYDLLDQVLYQYIEQHKGPAELLKMGFDETVLNRILKLVNTSEYKRYQFPPILRVSPKAFGMGRRLPIVGKYLS